MSKHKIKEVRDNNGNLRRYYADLKAGDKIVAKKTVMGQDDLGMSGRVFNTERWEQGKEYTIKGLSEFGFNRIPYFVDDTGCVAWSEVDFFDVVE